MEEDPRLLVQTLRRNRRGKLALQTAIIHLICSVACIIIGVFSLAIIKSNTIEKVFGFPLWIGLLVSKMFTRFFYNYCQKITCFRVCYDYTGYWIDVIFCDIWKAIRTIFIVRSNDFYCSIFKGNFLKVILHNSTKRISQFTNSFKNKELYIVINLPLFNWAANCKEGITNYLGLHKISLSLNRQLFN
jgi:uncharacterized membrane protein